jgi:hypothetical protein
MKKSVYVSAVLALLLSLMPLTVSAKKPGITGVPPKSCTT